MKKLTKCIIMAVFLLTAMGLLTTVQVSAKTITKNKKVYWYPGQDKTCVNDFEIFYDESHDTISELQTSNKKVATIKTVKYDKFGTDVIIIIRAKGIGKCTVSYSVTTNGNKTTYVYNYKVVKYRNPFKTIKVGKKNFKNKYNKTYIYLQPKAISGKLNIKVKKGYKIQKITRNADFNQMIKKIKNGKKYNFNKLPESIIIKVKDKKNGIVNDMVLQVGYYDREN